MHIVVQIILHITKASQKNKTKKKTILFSQTMKCLQTKSTYRPV